MVPWGLFSSWDSCQCRVRKTNTFAKTFISALALFLVLRGGKGAASRLYNTTSVMSSTDPTDFLVYVPSRIDEVVEPQKNPSPAWLMSVVNAAGRTPSLQGCQDVSV